MYNSSNSFYITLPSNVTYPKGNKANHFITHLATELDLKGKWECGLSEITYMRNWKFCNKPIEIQVAMATPSETSDNGFISEYYKIQLPASIYPTPTYFLNQVISSFKKGHEIKDQSGLKQIIDSMTFTFSDRFIEIKCTRKEPVAIIFPEYIAAMLGLDSPTLNFKDSTVKWVLPSSMINTTSL